MASSQHDPTARSVLPWFGLIALVLISDQMTKWSIERWLGPGAADNRWEMWGRFVALEYVQNRGAAFGMFGDASVLITILAVVISVGALVALWRDHVANPLTALALALIVGGALGNVADRVTRGYVVDFLAVGRWPKFNLADSAVVIGVLLMVLITVRDELASHPEEDNV